MGVRIICVGLLWLPALYALGGSQVAAQDQPGSQDAAWAPVASSESQPRAGKASDEAAAQPTSEHKANRSEPDAEPGVPSARYFFDNFSSASLDGRKWEAALGVTLTHDVRDQGRALAAVQFGAGRRGADRQPELRSVAISLAGVPGAELAYTVRHRGVEAGERLTVEYFSEDGRWATIERVVADGGDSIGFSRHMHVLPTDALHVAFRIRFRPDVNDENDTWQVGEVSLAKYQPLYTLAVRSHPARGARVELATAGDCQRLDGTTPFTRGLPGGTRVHLAAAPVVGERVFSHWSIDGEPVADRQRVLTLEVDRAIEAQVHYRQWVPGRSEASVAIVSAPQPGVRIALGPDPERLYTQALADTEHRCLTGEWLALLAPLRTAQVVFIGWVVNGEALPKGQNLLEHRVAGDDVLLAEYVLLGDMNGDEQLDEFDVNEFVTALIDPLAYAQRYPDLDALQRGDINGDGMFDVIDVEGFVDILLSD